MADRWTNQTTKDEQESNSLMLAGLITLYNPIRNESKDIARAWRERSPDENGLVWLRSNKRNQSLQLEINEKLRPQYKKIDDYIGKRYADEYGTKYYRKTYYSTQRFRQNNYNVKIRKYLNNDFRKAISNPLSKYMEPKLLQADRGKSLDRIYKTIRQGIIDGASLQNINKAIDIELGYRDKNTGKVYKNAEDYKGDIWKRKRVLRTELNRVRGQAETDEYKQEQEQGIDSDLILVETLDDRTRRQSAQMDGQKADKDGLFTYPDGRKAPRGSSGVAKWDINDRSTTVTVLSDESIEDYARRERLSKKTEVKPYRTFKEYAEDRGLTRNRYGQLVV